MGKMFIEFKGNIEIEKDMHDMLKACVSTDTTRQYLQNVHIDNTGEKGKVTATNGQLMVQYTVDMPIEACGWYECAKIGKKHLLLPVNSDFQPPNYDRVIPEYTKITLQSVELSGAKSDITKDSKQICSIILESKCKLNLDYVWNIKHLGDVVMYCHADNPEQAIMFKGNDVIYVIAPLYKD